MADFLAAVTRVQPSARREVRVDYFSRLSESHYRRPRPAVGPPRGVTAGPAGWPRVWISRPSRAVRVGYAPRRAPRGPRVVTGVVGAAVDGRVPSESFTGNPSLSPWSSESLAPSIRISRSSLPICPPPSCLSLVSPSPPDTDGRAQQRACRSPLASHWQRHSTGCRRSPVSNSALPRLHGGAGFVCTRTVVVNTATVYKQ